MRQFTLFLIQARLDFLQTFRSQLASEVVDYVRNSVPIILGTNVGSALEVDLTAIAVKCAEHVAGRSSAANADDRPFDWAPLSSVIDSSKLTVLGRLVACFATPLFSLESDLMLHQSTVTIGADNSTSMPLSVALLVPKLLSMGKIIAWMDEHMHDELTSGALLDHWDRRNHLVATGVGAPCALDIRLFCGGEPPVSDTAAMNFHAKPAYCGLTHSINLVGTNFTHSLAARVTAIATGHAELAHDHATRCNIKASVAW